MLSLPGRTCDFVVNDRARVRIPVRVAFPDEETGIDPLLDHNVGQLGT